MSSAGVVVVQASFLLTLVVPSVNGLCLRITSRGQTKLERKSTVIRQQEQLLLGLEKDVTGLTLVKDKLEAEVAALTSKLEAKHKALSETELQLKRAYVVHRCRQTISPT